MEELKHPQQQNVKDFLHLVGCRIQGDCPGPEDEVSNQKLFATAYFLVSALAGMDTKTKDKKREMVAVGFETMPFLLPVWGHSFGWRFDSCGSFLSSIEWITAGKAMQPDSDEKQDFLSILNFLSGAPQESWKSSSNRTCDSLAVLCGRDFHLVADLP